MTARCSSAPKRRRLVSAILALEPASRRARGRASRCRAGMAGGAVILFEGDDYIGGPVNLAARLCDAAAPHEILASAELAESCRTRRGRSRMGSRARSPGSSSRSTSSASSAPVAAASSAAGHSRRRRDDARAPRRSRFESDGHVGRLVARTGPTSSTRSRSRCGASCADLGDRLLDDPGDVRALVVVGEGRAFSSGIDTTVFAARARRRRATSRRDDPGPASGSRSRRRTGSCGTQDAFTWLEEAPFATIAAVRGYALGAGLQLALACDIRVVARGTKLGLLEFKYGIIPDLGGTQRLPRLVGAGKAKELIFTAAQIDADEAERIGLAEHVVADEELETRPSTSSPRRSRRSRRSPSAPRSVRSPPRDRASTVREGLLVEAEGQSRVPAFRRHEGGHRGLPRAARPAVLPGPLTGQRSTGLPVR